LEVIICILQIWTVPTWIFIMQADSLYQHKFSKKSYSHLVSVQHLEAFRFEFSKTKKHI